MLKSAESCALAVPSGGWTAQDECGDRSDHSGSLVVSSESACTKAGFNQPGSAFKTCTGGGLTLNPSTGRLPKQPFLQSF